MKAVKGQAVADFIIDHKIKDVEILSEVESLFVGQKAWVMYFDGSKHKDGAGIGILVISPTGVPTRFSFEIDNTRTNNEVEYAALNAGLELLLSLNAKIAIVKGDSQLVIRQLTGQYNCVNSNMVYYFSYALVSIRKFDEITFEHIPRIENEIAMNWLKRHLDTKFQWLI